MTQSDSTAHPVSWSWWLNKIACGPPAQGVLGKRVHPMKTLPSQVPWHPGSRSSSRWSAQWDVCPALALLGVGKGVLLVSFFLWNCEKSWMCINVMFLPCRQVNHLLSTFPVFFQWTSSIKESIRGNSLKALIRFTIDPKTYLRNPAFVQHSSPVYSQNFNSDTSNLSATETPRWIGKKQGCEWALECFDRSSSPTQRPADLWKAGHMPYGGSLGPPGELWRNAAGPGSPDSLFPRSGPCLGAGVWRFPGLGGEMPPQRHWEWCFPFSQHLIPCLPFKK